MQLSWEVLPISDFQIFTFWGSMQHISYSIFIFCLVNLVAWEWSPFSCGFLPTKVEASWLSLPRHEKNFHRRHRAFLEGIYEVKGDAKNQFCVRQVPGDGSCLFHALSSWLSYLQTGRHTDFDWRMRNLSLKLRRLAVSVLRQPNTTLVLEDGEEISTTQLVDIIGNQYNLAASEYCTSMLDPRTWGGGPEIVALSHHFKCPIHVYQLSNERPFLRPFSSGRFQLEVCAKFGSPMFDAKQPICILCADGRFPHVKPGKHKSPGDHFLALFPVSQSVDRVVNSGDTENERLTAKTRYLRSLQGGTSALKTTTSRTRSHNTKISLKPNGFRRKRSSTQLSHDPPLPCLLKDCPKLAKDDTFLEWMECSYHNQPANQPVDETDKHLHSGMMAKVMRWFL